MRMTNIAFTTDVKKMSPPLMKFLSRPENTGKTLDLQGVVIEVSLTAALLLNEIPVVDRDG